MVENNITDHKIFSLYFTDIESNESAIIFGGYDRKYM